MSKLVQIKDLTYLLLLHFISKSPKRCIKRLLMQYQNVLNEYQKVYLSLLAIDLQQPATCNI